MKVVLFCGGRGMRMRSGVDSLPKPMTLIGDRPVLWHIMRYYASFGHTEFVLCLGWGADVVKDYFLDYRETRSNDFVLSGGGTQVRLLSRDIADWTITFVDTGLDTPIGERLRRVRPHLDGDEMFCANYGDVLCDAPLDRIVADFAATDAVGTLLAVNPTDTFHVVRLDDQDRLTGIEAVSTLGVRVNGGYFVLRQGIFDYLGPGEDLVGDACVRAAADGRFRAVRFDGFWAPMDTQKERNALEDMHQAGVRPWAVWERAAG